MDALLKDQIFATHALAGVGSVTLSTALTYPIDTIKVLIQVGSGSSKQLTITQVLNRVQSFSGNSGLYSGFRWLVVGRTLGVGARFGTYEILTAFYKDGREDNYVYISEAFLAGLVSGAAESLISSPFELIKLRDQVTSASRIPNLASLTEKGAVAPLIQRLLRGYTPDKMALNHSVGLLSTLTTKHPNMMSALQEYPWMMTGSGRPPSLFSVRKPSEIISLEGWGALWRGLRSGVVRDSIFGGMFFSTWQFLHRAMLDWKAAGMDPEPRSDDEIGPLSPLAASLAAGVSGLVAAAASHCFDTAKCRSQCIVLPKFVSLERKLLKWREPGNRFERVTGIHPADRNLLFRGLGLRMARSGIASFIMLNSVVNRLHEMSPAKRLPIVILHRYRITGGPSQNLKNKALLESWKSLVHFTLLQLVQMMIGAGCTLLLLLSVCLTNDEMRDHLFQLRGTSFFPRWKKKHQVRLSVSRRGLNLHIPPPFSIVIQVQ